MERYTQGYIAQGSVVGQILFVISTVKLFANDIKWSSQVLWTKDNKIILRQYLDRLVEGSHKRLKYQIDKTTFSITTNKNDFGVFINEEIKIHQDIANKVCKHH